MNNELQTIPISSLYESSENSRHVFDGRKLKELAQSIKVQGIKVCLMVRQGDEGKFEIVAGGRRYRAAQLAGQTAVPCQIREYTDAEARDARLIENLQRADLSPLEEAESYHQPRRRDRGRGAFNRRRTNSTDRQEREVRAFPVTLAGSHSPVKEALRKEKISLGHALEVTDSLPMFRPSC